MIGLVVGLGSIGRRHARNWARLGLGEVWIARQHGAAQPEALGVEARLFDRLDVALRQGPDVVIVANPTSLHVETAQQALEAGAHVLAEKPLGHSLEGVARLLETASSHKRVLAVGYHLRFARGLARLRDIVRGGGVGRPVSARAEAGEYLPDWHPWEDYRQSYSGRRDLGGGAVLTFSHEIDALCWVLGAPRSVQASARRASGLEIDTEDVAELLLDFPSAVGSIHVDYVRRPPRRWLEVVGEEGVVRWEYEADRVLRYAPATREWRVEEGDPRATRNDMYLAELAQFAACVRGEVARPAVDGEQGAAVLAIALAALHAAESGRRIDLESEGEPVGKWLNSLGRDPA